MEAANLCLKATSSLGYTAIRRRRRVRELRSEVVSMCREGYQPCRRPLPPNFLEGSFSMTSHKLGKKTFLYCLIFRQKAKRLFRGDVLRYVIGCERRGKSDSSLGSHQAFTLHT